MTVLLMGIVSLVNLAVLTFLGRVDDRPLTLWEGIALFGFALLAVGFGHWVDRRFAA